MPAAPASAAVARSVAPLLSIPGTGTRIDRLVQAAAEQASARGLEGATARSIAAAAGASASAINYNFGGLEQLFAAAFDHGAALAADWLLARRREIEALPSSPAGAVLALEHMVAAWTQDARPLALLYQEALAADSSGGAAPAWTGLWRDFWTAAAARFGLEEGEGRLLHLFFESEALYHLSAWSPALERAALREMCEHFGAVYLGAPARPAVGALALAERTAGVLPEGAVPPGGAMRIAEAAAAVVQAQGLGGLTHRAVAARAGVTTGAVTHHFRTVEDLMAGAIRGQVAALFQARSRGGGGLVPPETLHTAQDLLEASRAAAVADRPDNPSLARRHLFRAALRRPELAGAAAVIRFAHGGTSRDILPRIFAIEPAALCLHAGVMSRLVSALRPATRDLPAADAPWGELLQAVVDRLAAGLPRRLD